MGIIIDLIKGTILVWWRHLQSIVWKVPIEWGDGNRTIVFVPGYGGHLIFHRNMGNYFNKKGFKILEFLEFNGYEKIELQSKKLAKFVENISDPEVILIGHSRGGLIAKFMIDNYPNANKKVGSLIGVSVPWQGSYIGYVLMRNLNEIRPDGELVRRIVAEKSNLKKITNIFPKIDDRVIPNKNLKLDGVKNIMIDLVGHAKILDSSEAMKLIDKELSIRYD